ncbi:MAG: STAS domain-containing protein [Myxococcaceae bacterium]|jgi:anti-anti-sigma regulatory factor|nr:STAS domain-containing protein [Myxococcaceae bacterium]
MESLQTTITLAERLEMSAVTALHQRLVEALRARAPVAIDGSQVTAIDSASAQVLLAFALSAREARVDVSWTRSDALDAFFNRTALAAAFTA